ncbi:MAG: hypothetical protein IJ740_06135 [Ruminococcus sp.]|nr:hypothetical protein [Ruminococcus sp.]
MKEKPLKKLLMIIAVIIAAFFIFTELCIYYYLKTYGFGIKELPQTTLVYFHLSTGFVAEENDDMKTVIGGHSIDAIEDKLEKDGYYMYEQMGLDQFYKKNENKDKPNHYDLWISCGNEWCHWFRVYYTDKDFEL